MFPVHSLCAAHILLWDNNLCTLYLGLFSAVIKINGAFYEKLLRHNSCTSVLISMWMSMFWRECLVTIKQRRASAIGGICFLFLGSLSFSASKFLQQSCKIEWIIQKCWATSQIRRSMMSKLFFPKALLRLRGTLAWQMWHICSGYVWAILDFSDIYLHSIWIKGDHKWLITSKHVKR